MNFEVYDADGQQFRVVTEPVSRLLYDPARHDRRHPILWTRVQLPFPARDLPASSFSVAALYPNVKATRAFGLSCPVIPTVLALRTISFAKSDTLSDITD